MENDTPSSTGTRFKDIGPMGAVKGLIRVEETLQNPAIDPSNSRGEHPANVRAHSNCILGKCQLVHFVIVASETSWLVRKLQCAIARIGTWTVAASG